ncbi:LamG-like jellyroll fold domain-containing protein [Luteolibacter marinus]|uniref:LamG-like jellyroll fold domain-containing protein n=1 Tax=Luteolibacter marinus TaxID=2776705 RepID=UPI001866F46F|nr:LamG-like jellyroll fold domain-containing protein [Luteolibacter marinus]
MIFRSAQTALRNPFKLATLIWCSSHLAGNALTYHISYLEDEGKRAQITQVMDEAVAAYNATSNIDVDINVIYHSGIPTAQANYNGELGFGGSISTQVAIHEIAHYLGSGTTTQWEDRFGGGNVWNGPALKRYVKLFDGPRAEIYKSGVHYYPYGFNYGNEDNPNARYRIGRILRAMRMDMGGQDGDGDGMPDEWERYKSGTTALKVGGDTDGDGISDFDEWWTDSHPMWACPVKDGHVYQIRSRLSQMLMEADSGNPAPGQGANVRQNPANGSDLQKWTAKYVEGGYWKFVNVASGKALEVIDWSIDVGANVGTWEEYPNNANQQWRIFPGASGAAYWKMGNRNATNMVIDVNGGNNATGPNTNIGQYTDDLNAFNLEWMFDDVTPGVMSDGLVANYKLEGNPRDFSGRNFHGTTSGGVSYTAGRVDGLAATFNGSNGSIRVPAMVERNFSLACWVKTTATAGGTQWYNGMGIIDGEVPGVARDFGLALVGNKAAFGVGAADLTLTSSNAINDGNWHHLAATLNTDTGAMSLYVDGILRASGTGPAGARSAPAFFRLGSINGTTGFLNGSIDEARLYNKVLGPQEISRLANTGQSLVASYAFDGTTRDATLFGNHGDGMGVTYAPGKVGNQAVQLNGTSSFVKLPAPVTADFSVAYWVKTSAVGGSGQWYAGKSMVDADVPGVANDWGISLVGNHAAFGVGNTGAGTTIESTTNINDGNWHHVVATRVNATGAMKLYVNGALQGSATGSTSLRDAPGGIRVGSTLFGGSFFDGAIDELKIFNYAVSDSQAAALAQPLPAPWAAADIGQPASDGYSGYSAAGDGVFTVTGGGLDIGGTSDQFQFVNSVQAGDKTLVARLTVLPVNARAGLMFRESTAADSAFVGLVVDQSAGLRFIHRDTSGGTSGQTGSTIPIAVPVWLKLVRAGDSFTALYSTGPTADGDWIPLGSHTIQLAASPLAGLAVTSRIAGQVVTASFTGLNATETSPAAIWRQQEFGSILATGDAADDQDPDGDTLSNIIERALGTDPNLPTPPSARPSATSDGGFLVLTYTRSLAATDLTVSGWWSENLGAWSDAGVTDVLISTDGSIETRAAKVSLDTFANGQGFMRLDVRE